MVEDAGKKPLGLALVAAVPLALGLSHPAVFVAGGISLALAAKAWKARPKGCCCH